VASRVDSAFTFYKNQQFKKASLVLTRTEKLYPKSDLSDRVAYLKTLLVIRTQPPLTARASVEKFYKDYPNSPLVPQAQALASSYKKQESGEIAGALASTQKPVVSVFRPGEVDNRIRIFYKEDETPAKALKTPAVQAPSPQPTKTVPTPVSTPLQKTDVVVPNGSPAPTPAPTSNAPAPSPVATTLTAPVVAPTTSAPAVTAPAPAPTTAYTTQLSAAHAVVLVFPKATPPSADLITQLTAYNARFFQASNLQVQAQPLGTDQNLIIVRALPGSKVAQSYATKLRGPQSPLARLRGAGYQPLVISLENLALLQSSGDLTGYTSFYQRVYK
jgi:hypothetical protein